jgi:hypothetical protein
MNARLEVSSPIERDMAIDMTPLPQPTAMTSTQTLVEDAHDLKMYKEHAIVEI